MLLEITIDICIILIPVAVYFCVNNCNANRRTYQQPPPSCFGLYEEVLKEENEKSVN